MIFFVLLFFELWGFGNFERAQMAKMCYYRKERSQRAWSNYVRERPATDLPLADFARM